MHVYSVGEEVTFGLQARDGSGTLVKNYTIKAQLPPLGDKLQYRIKSPLEPFERVVVQDQLGTDREIADVPAI